MLWLQSHARRKALICGKEIRRSRRQARRDPSAEAGPAASRSTETPVMDLGKSVVIKGELSGSEDLALYGQMEGSIRLPDHTLTIGPHAEIKAQISVKAVVNPGRG